jgi:hypothetical protein
MSALIHFVNSFLSILTSAFSWLLDGAILVIQSACYFIYDGFLTTITAFVNSLDLSSLAFTSLTTWGLMPDQMLYVINQIGLPQGLTMLFYAYVIRLTLNLIPAALTRV